MFLDDLGRNVKAASEVGMITVRVRETEKTLIKLETLLGIRLTAETEIVDSYPNCSPVRELMTSSFVI